MVSFLTTSLMLIALFILLAAAIDRSGADDRRCMPMQYEGKVIGKVVLMGQGEAELMDIVAGVSVDYAVGKQVFQEGVYMDGKLVDAYNIFSFPNHTYIADMVNKKCNKVPGAAVTQICSDSPGLVYRASWTMGTQMTDTYNIDIGSGSKSTLTFTRDPFTLVSQMLVQQLSDNKQFTSVQVGNTTAGIKDPKVFDLPDFCTTGEIGPAQPLHWSQVLLSLFS